MKVIAEKLGKKFNREWIFRNLNFTFESGRQYAITGNNGSGKTTLLKVIAAVLQVNEGTVSYFRHQKQVSPDEIYRELVMIGPYTGLIEELSLIETIEFYRKFKRLSVENDVFIEELGLAKSKHKLIKDFSSGMKQKVKLGLAIFSENSLILLDEPTSNFDKNNILWYQENVSTLKKDKLLIICSNQQHEYEFCDDILNISSFQK